MDEQIRVIIMQLSIEKLHKLIKELEAMDDKDYLELIEFLKSFV